MRTYEFASLWMLLVYIYVAEELVGPILVPKRRFDEAGSRKLRWQHPCPVECVGGKLDTAMVA
jgi:hypothetical protein